MIEILQVDSELALVTELYRQAQPKRVLEIGVWEGGTLKVWLENARPGAHVVAVDKKHPSLERYGEWCAQGVEIHVITGLSQDIHTILHLTRLGPYDWVFIDGDHSTAGVRADVATCLPLIHPGGHLLLHDIAPPSGVESYPPGVLLDELAEEGYAVERIVDLAPSSLAHGIGVVKL